MISRRDVLRYLGVSAALPLLPDVKGRGTGDSLNEPTRIPFTLQGRRGQVAVRYGVTVDPVAAGLDALPGLNVSLDACRGFPSIESVVEHYDGGGYRGLFGWVQIVTRRFYQSLDTTEPPAETSRSVDTLPSVADLKMPFLTFGMLPRLFDAPCRSMTAPYAQLQWTADTFLTTAPIRSRSEEIHRLVGIRWGYALHADGQRYPIAPFPLVVTGADAWNEFLPYLREKCPDWQFSDS
jgi:hypothetical protein